MGGTNCHNIFQLVNLSPDGLDRRSRKVAVPVERLFVNNDVANANRPKPAQQFAGHTWIPRRSHRQKSN